MLVPILLACTAEPAHPVALPSLSDTAGPLRLVAVGDTGHTNATARRVSRSIVSICEERGCDALLLLGDNIYPRGAVDPEHANAALATWVDVGLPIYAVLGNHDWGHGHDRVAAEAQVALSGPDLHIAQDWVARATNVTLFGLDTTRVFWDGAQRSAWLAPALEQAAGWRIVLGHHPLKSEGPHGNAGAYEGWRGVPFMSGTSVQNALESTLCGRADVYLAGHDHSRQWLQHCGVQLVISGAGSAATDIEGHGNEPRFAAASHGFVWLSVGAELTLSFYDEGGRLDHEGRVPPPPRLSSR